MTLWSSSIWENVSTNESSSLIVLLIKQKRELDHENDEFSGDSNYM